MIFLMGAASGAVSNILSNLLDGQVDMGEMYNDYKAVSTASRALRELSGDGLPAITKEERQNEFQSMIAGPLNRQYRLFRHPTLGHVNDTEAQTALENAVAAGNAESAHNPAIRWLAALMQRASLASMKREMKARTFWHRQLPTWGALLVAFGLAFGCFGAAIVLVTRRPTKHLHQVAV